MCSASAAAPRLKDAGIPRVLLLLDAPGDRRVLAAWLAAEHDVIEAASDEALKQEFDLCIADDSAYARLWKRVQELKRASEPVFLPFVLLSSEHAAPLVAQLPTHDIDETLEAPIAREVLVSRVDVLLERRARERHLDEAREVAMEELRAVQGALELELETTTLLLGAANTLASRPSLDDVLHSLTGVVLNATNHGRVTVTLWDTNAQQCVVAASRGEQPIPTGTVMTPSFMSPTTKKAFEERKASLIDHDALLVADREAGDQFGSHLALHVPLFYREKSVGLLAVDDYGQRRDFTNREVEIIEGVASQASLAIENAKLLEGERERARLEASIADVGARLASSLDIDETLPDVVQRVSDALNADGISLADRLKGSWKIREVSGRVETEFERGDIITDAEFPSATAVRPAGEPLATPDAARDGACTQEVKPVPNIQSSYTHPLVVHGQVTGLMTVFFSGSRVLSDAEDDYLRRAAFAISVTEENSRLYKSEHKIADRLQEALLALPDRVSGIEFAHSYHSATEAARVGGDFYDLFELHDSHVGIVIGDVAGKGLDAAVLTSIVKNTIRAHAYEKAKTPEQIMTLTNEVIYKATAADSFVTVFFGILHCASGTLVYTNAGHTTAACLRADGSVASLAVTGPLLGAFEDARFDEAETWLGHDELLFLYTDGLTEARHLGELYGEDRLFEKLSAVTHAPAADVVREVIADVLTFSGGHLPDDLATLAVKRLEPGKKSADTQKLEMQGGTRRVASAETPGATSRGRQEKS